LIHLSLYYAILSKYNTPWFCKGLKCNLETCEI
jgi:hypothetical protein